MGLLDLTWPLVGVVYVPLVDSEYLDPVAELESIDENHVALTPASYASWSAMFAAHPDEIDYILTPGDYTGWGMFQFANWDIAPRSGTAERRRTIRCLDTEAPWDRSAQAIVGLFTWWNSHYWTITGLHFTREFFARQDSSNIVLHECQFETGGYGVRFLGRDCTAQRNLVLGQDGSTDAPAMQVDSIGIEDPTGNKFLDNEIVDNNDGPVISDHEYDFADVSGTVIDGNDVYLTSAKHVDEGDGYEYADAENAIDIKNGSPDAQNPVLITNNRFWGYRPTAPSVSAGGKGSNGAAASIHFQARNIYLGGNIIEDSPIGIHETIWPVNLGLPRDPRGIVVEKNIFANIRRFTDLWDDEDAAFRVEMGVELVDNTLVDCGRLASMELAPGATGANSVNGTQLARTAQGVWTSEWAAGEGNGNSSAFIIHYQRRRFTGPEWATIIGVGSSRQSARVVLPSASRAVISV